MKTSGTNNLVRRYVRDLMPSSMRQAIYRYRVKRMCRIIEPKLASARAEGLTVVHFLHIGKTGGTAVKHALTGKCYTDRFFIALRGHGIAFRHVPKGDKVVFLLRDPVSRFFSGFYSTHTCTYSLALGPRQRRALKRFKSAAELADALSSTESKSRAQAEQAMADIVHLNMPQAYWVDGPDYLSSRAEDILLVGFQETLDADFQTLKHKLGLPEDVTLPTDPVKANRAAKSPGPPLSVQGEANVRRWYAKDTASIEFCRELMSKRTQV